MVQKDYLMRMIEQFAAIVMKIIFNKENGNVDAALLEIDNAYRNLTGFEPQHIKNMSELDILNQLSADDNLDVDRCIIIAELFREEGEIQEMQQVEATDLFTKSLFLYIQAINNTDHSYLDNYTIRVEELAEKLFDDDLPDHCLFALFEYYDAMKRYGKAEDVLFMLMEQSFPNIRTIGETFYCRLLALDDEELRLGNLPRDEIHEGLVQLNNFYL